MTTILRSNLITSLTVALAFQLLRASVAAEAPASAKIKPYPLATCVVSGEKLGGAMGEPHVFTYQGREIKLCCKSCLKDFEAEPAKFVAKVDEATKRVKPYPLAICLVSNEKLGGDMGEPLSLVFEGREIKLCCKDCIKDFNKEPAKFLRKLDQALKKQPKAGVSGIPAAGQSPHYH